MDDQTTNLIRPLWPAPDNIIAAVTTRRAPDSTRKQHENTYSSFNLATHVHDDRISVQRNRSLLSIQLQQLAKNAIEYKNDPLIGEPCSSPPQLEWNWLNQTHSNRVVEFLEEDGNSSRRQDNLDTFIPDADAIFSQQPMAVCSVLTADCLPILICSHDGQVVGAAHAGWRGIAKGVIHNTILAMTERTDIKPGQLYAWLGPAIGSNRFEVGPDVWQAFSSSRLQSPETAEALAQAFRPSTTTENKYIVDIYQLGSIALRQCGVHHIYGGGFCTFDDERFYSHRRDGETGRMASMIFRVS